MSNTFTQRHQPQRSNHNTKPYSPFPANGKLYHRNANGECFKALFINSSFVWIDINPSEYLSANPDMQAN